MTLTVGIDARAAAEVPAGRGRYVRELIAALERGWDDARFVLYARREHGPALDERFRWDLIHERDPVWHLVAAAKANRSCDVFLSTNSYLTAWFTRVPTAIVVYDLVPFVEGAQAQARAARIERATIRPALRRAAALACISRATRDDLVARFPRTANRASVIPLAAGEPFTTPVDPAAVTDVRERHELQRPYVLAAGTLEPRKNLERLIKAWSSLRGELRTGHVLALVGPEGWDHGPVLSAAAERGDEVRVLGFVPDEDLAALYAGCAAFAYPSLYEGFGLPVLEAMSAGAPVVTSNVSSLPEVAGNAAVLVDPLDVGAIRAGLEQVLGDEFLSADLRKRGLERAATFSWDRTARRTVALLSSIAKD